jgi:sigma-B regulation protein RsbU (phosphoserine phosphatase)
MQNTGQSSGEDELIRLLLKRQSELNSLLEVTRAINKNASTPVLTQMLEVILQNYLQVGKFRFLIEKDRMPVYQNMAARLSRLAHCNAPVIPSRK